MTGGQTEPGSNTASILDDCHHEPRTISEAEDQAEPFSVRHEVKYFFGKGIALGLAAMLNWGLPPLVAMMFAGHTPNSAQLQASMGYGRVWFNCTVLMPSVGMFAYCSNVIPGCIGAGRPERIPRYLQRGIIFSLIAMMPLYLLQFFADSIMRSLGVPEVNAIDVGVYCRLMIMSSILTIVDGNIEITLVNLGYARSTTVNSFVCGLALDVGTSFLLIYHLDMGIVGVALSQISVKLGRVIVWGLIICIFGLRRKMCQSPSAGTDVLCRRAEVKTFLGLALPQIMSNFAGWFVFELQVMALANVEGLPKEALAAGSIWVQCEGSLASAQDGWIRITSMRSLVLLGKRDPGAPKAFTLFTVLATIVVAISNVALLIWKDAFCHLVSNDAAVREWLDKILWVLVIHTQTRILSINASVLFVPLDKGMMWTLVMFVCFYIIASPITCSIALTDWVTKDITLKMTACVSNTLIAQIFIFIIGFAYLWRLDWMVAGEVIHRRANNDKREAAQILVDIEQQPAAELTVAGAVFAA
eukprot:CAMPEP_0206453460 /NCGR_PEP_ID=MMETSP0324_2-20121206/20556_1 /ASSEMBLY_ACC=CAM_ASM_000836 /TAXON_ID=2866 /ORGANISM="Crypthecodinium cohnii, Strain Seligo" /LENGTH=528 /DNA_ID=CAMNT_0053923749 /DNA_START=22 /DNA_END=1608 /DNA_ORIENTATION=-